MVETVKAFAKVVPRAPAGQPLDPTHVFESMRKRGISARQRTPPHAARTAGCL